MPSSSAIQLGDPALTWSNTQGNADMSKIDGDIAVDRGLATAMILSLFTDARAQDDDAPPSGDPNDRRGWWADQFAAVAGDEFGSRLWLLDRAKQTNETLLLAKQYALECWAWMIEDKVVASIDVTATNQNGVLLLAGSVGKPNGDRVAFRFSHVWDHIQEDL